MDTAKFEELLKNLFNQDFSAGTETFRNTLLERCLEELDSEDASDSRELTDSSLEYLAAAGDLSDIRKNEFDVNKPSH